MAAGLISGPGGILRIQRVEKNPGIETVTIERRIE